GGTASLGSEPPWRRRIRRGEHAFSVSVRARRDRGVHARGLRRTSDVRACLMMSRGMSSPTPPPMRESHVRRIPRWIKWAYTAFVAVIAPVYARQYGWRNFL